MISASVIVHCRSSFISFVGDAAVLQGLFEINQLVKVFSSNHLLCWNVTKVNTPDPHQLSDLRGHWWQDQEEHVFISGKKN